MVIMYICGVVYGSVHTRQNDELAYFTKNRRRSLQMNTEYTRAYCIFDEPSHMRTSGRYSKYFFRFNFHFNFYLGKEKEKSKLEKVHHKTKCSHSVSSWGMRVYVIHVCMSPSSSTLSGCVWCVQCINVLEADAHGTRIHWTIQCLHCLFVGFYFYSTLFGRIVRWDYERHEPYDTTRHMWIWYDAEPLNSADKHRTPNTVLMTAICSVKELFYE